MGTEDSPLRFSGDETGSWGGCSAQGPGPCEPPGSEPCQTPVPFAPGGPDAEQRKVAILTVMSDGREKGPGLAARKGVGT